MDNLTIGSEILALPGINDMEEIEEKAKILTLSSKEIRAIPLERFTEVYLLEKKMYHLRKGQVGIYKCFSQGIPQLDAVQVAVEGI